MPNAVQFIIGADSQPFSREMRQMESIAQSSGRNIGRRMAEGAHIGYSGLLREAITIPREIIEGRGIGRVIGSGSIFIQYLSQLSGKSKEAGAANEALAATWDALAFKSARAAKQAGSYAAEISGTIGPLTAAQAALLKGATLQEQKLREQTLAYKAKAVAAAEAAEAERIEAYASGQAAPGLLSTISGWVAGGVGAAVVGVGLIVGGLAAIWYGWHRVNKEAEEYAKNLQKAFESSHMRAHVAGIDSLADAWQRVAENVHNASAEYNSAIQQGERLMRAAQATNTFEERHAELQHRLNLAHARTPAQRAAEDARYDNQQGDLLNLAHARERSALETTQARATAEARTLHQQADAMRTPGGMPIEEPETTRNLLSNAQRAAEEAEKWLRDHPPVNPAHYRSGRGWVADMLGSTARYDDAARDAETRRTMESYIRNLAPAQERARDQESGQRARGQVISRAQQAQERANAIQNDMPDLTGRQRLEEQRASELRVIELALQQSEQERRGRAEHGYVNDAQRIGFSYIAGASPRDEGLAVARRAEQHLGRIHADLDTLVRRNHNHHTPLNQGRR